MTSIIFFHRSVGRNLIHVGHLYELLHRSPGLRLDDYDQNTDVLTQSNDGRHKAGLVFPGGNTRPADFAVIFNEHVAKAYRPIRDFALSYDVIVIKSCFPNTNIRSEQELASIQAQYESICRFFATQRMKRLMILTSPPLRPLLTKSARAARARRLADWLKGTNFAANVSVFDLFDILAAPPDKGHANMLRREYCRWLPFDSHPNSRASKLAAKLFSQYLIDTVG